jgi:hypothetical protein
VRAGLIKPGNPERSTVKDFATEIVTLCERIAGRYPNPDCTEDTVGDVVRGTLFVL